MHVDDDKGYISKKVFEPIGMGCVLVSYYYVESWNLDCRWKHGYSRTLYGQPIHKCASEEADRQ